MNMAKRISRLLLAAMLLSSLSACSTMKGWFSMDDDDPRAPAELQDIDQQLNIKTLWSASIGNGQGKGYYRLTPAINSSRIYAVAANGELAAFDRESGKRLWEVELEREVSGGVGLYEDSLFLGMADGAVTRIDASSGELLWSAVVSGEILSAPQSDGTVVVAQSYDGKVQAFDYETGTALWTYDANMPVLTLRGTSTPLLVDNKVLVGFANGRVVAFNAESGALTWEVRVAMPKGRSEIERIADVDGTMELVGTILYAASYQGNLAAIDTASGRKLWQQELSSFSGVSQGFGNVYVAQENGAVSAWSQNGQGQRWLQDALGWRKLSRPTPVSSYVAVADYEGYIHFLSQVDGELVGRTRADSDGVRADMIGDGDVLYIYGNDGELEALRIGAK